MTAKKHSKSIPGFDFDPETGRYVLVPCDFGAIFGNKRPQPSFSNSKKSREVSDGPCAQPAKYRKSEYGVRKELFKVPAGNQQSTKWPNRDKQPKSTGVRKSLAKEFPPRNSGNVQPRRLPEKKKITPMKTISESTLPVKSTGYQFKQPLTPQLKFSAKKETDDNVKTPDSVESTIDEFVRLEQLLKTPKITNESPVSNVCNLFESKMLLNGQITEAVHEPVGQKKLVAEIRRIVKMDQKLCEDTSKKIREVMNQQARHEENLRTLLSLVDQLDGSNQTKLQDVNEDSDDKENSSIRRSLRLQNKNTSSPSDQWSPPAGSPVILKSGDLRKSTLTKSLVSKCHQYQISSPRIKRALDLYNSTKSTCGGLLTPKLSRGQLVEPPMGSSLRNNLSYRVQQQCFMLHDSPGHK